jgi:hypothetical protein
MEEKQTSGICIVMTCYHVLVLWLLLIPLLNFCMQRIKHPVHDEITEEAHEYPAVLQWHANLTASTYLLRRK